MDKGVAVKDIINFLGSEIIRIDGNPENIYVINLKPPELVDKDSLDWIGKQKQNKQQIAEETAAQTIICDTSVIFTEKIAAQNKVLICVNNPRLIIALVADKFFLKKPEPGVHSTAYLHPKAVVDSTVYIGANCSIGKCKIHEGTTIYPNVTIYDGVSIGKNVLIQAGAVIGTDGLGCERRDDGTLIKFTHLGGVEIGDDVEIGANCQIARGALSNTIIGRGCKINGLCFIAHNCVLDENVWITGNTMLAGSVRVGKNATIFSSVIVREQRSIGQRATIGMGSVVTKDVPAGETWLGNPAKKVEK